jgi:polysaccharide pyruvyl transferase WcaK-like protein
MIAKAKVAGTARSVLCICGDLHNLGDLALLLENLAYERDRRVLARQWSDLPVGIAAQVQEAGGNLFDGRRLLASLRQARNADMVIGGGQIVRQNTSLRSLGYLALAAAVVRWSGGRIEARGLGIGETRGIRAALWRSILRRARTIEVRDDASFARALALCPQGRVRKGLDLVLRGDVALRAAGEPVAPAIVVALCKDDSERRAVDEKRLLGLLDEARRRWPGAALVGAVHDLRPGADSAAVERLAAHGVGAFDSGGDLGRLLALYRDAEIVLTNRLHAGVFASLYGRPLVVLDDGNDKLAILHEALSGVLSGQGNEHDSPAAVLDRALAPSKRERGRRLATARASPNGSPGETVLFNVKFSPNLGDGIIAECLEDGLRRSHAGLAPKSVDLAGRDRFDVRAGKGRRILLQVLERLPTRLRHAAMPAFVAAVVRFRLRARWKEAIASCDSAVVGGGNLLADADQNFPIKVSNVLDLCGRQGVPVAISHVGVTPRWSNEGRSRFRSALERVRLIGVSVRDDRSAANYRDEFDAPLPSVALDPGLLCCETYGPREAPRERSARRVGICLTSPLVLRLHGEGEVDGDLFMKWLRAGIERAARRGVQIVLFTNGSPEDEAFADDVMACVGDRAHVTRMPRFMSPGALVRFIGELDAVVAHRLHACIAAYSYRVPAIGLSWDRKLDSFFDLVGRRHFVCDWRSTGPGDLATLIEQAFADPPDPVRHDAVLQSCREGIAALAAKLAEAKRAA